MTGNPPLILLVEDEPQMRRFLRVSLTGHDFRLIESETGRDAFTQAATHNPEAILLDLGLPDMDGIEVTRRLREWTATPIIVLSARGQEQDKIAALDAGADDYLTKPFSMGELLARIRVALRHRNRVAGEEGEAVFSTGDLQVDLSLREVRVGDEEVRLTPTEYNLLAALVRNAGRVLTHSQLLKEAWGPTHSTQTHYVRIFMSQLRRKIEKNPARPRYLITELGVGYRLRAE